MLPLLGPPEMSSLLTTRNRSVTNVKTLENFSFLVRDKTSLPPKWVSCNGGGEW